MTLRFCQASPDCSKILKAIAKRVITANYVHFLGLDAVGEFIGSGMSDKEIDDGISNCTVILQENTILGFSITKENLLHLIMIDVPYQNQGYGSKLLAYTEEDLFQEYEEIHLQTFRNNTRALKFYLKCGWKIYHETEDELSLLFLKKAGLRISKTK